MELCKQNSIKSFASAYDHNVIQMTSLTIDVPKV
jgi:hypothetical protein